MRHNAEYFDGAISEVQVMDAYASADYIKLSYENQKEPAALFSTPHHHRLLLRTARSTGSTPPPRAPTCPGTCTISPCSSASPAPPSSPIAVQTQSAAGYPLPGRRRGDLAGLFQSSAGTPAADSAEVWVKVPKVDGNSAGDFITMYYNDRPPESPCRTGNAPPACSTSANGFEAVWHLNDDGTRRRGTDATAQRHTTAPIPASTNDDVTASSAPAGNFDGTDELHRPAGNAVRPTSIAVTISVWVKPGRQAPMSALRSMLRQRTPRTGTAGSKLRRPTSRFDAVRQANATAGRHRPATHSDGHLDAYDRHLRSAQWTP